MAQGIFNLKQVNQAVRQGAWSGTYAPTFVEYLVVAGGGGGAINRGGGGGAGGLLSGIVAVTAGASYTVTVGGGGAGKTPNGQGNNGSNSVFGNLTATGGGGGGDNTGSIGSAGGSGGGSGNSNGPFGGQATVGQGNAGGGGVYAASNYGGGGGGGAGSIGSNGTGTLPGNGGQGIASDISGTRTVYAGGGGGEGYIIEGLGGQGGGGKGAGATALTNGTPNTGGGGGGGGGPSGGGGSGIVIVRYPGSIQFYTGGAVTYANGYVVHKFYVTDTLAPTTPTAISTTGDYQISRSLRFNPADTTYLSRTPATATNRRTWTWSAWVKVTALGLAQYGMFSSRGSAGAVPATTMGLYTDDSFIFSDNGSGASILTTQLFRDLSAWYHIVVAADTTQATSSDRIKIFVNGTQVTSFSSATYPAQNSELAINSTLEHNIGKYANAGNYANAYMTEVNFIDGQALTPSSFGATSTTTGVWSPIQYTSTYGTNGFYLNFSDNSNTTAATLGKDYSGNGNNWTPNNFSVTAGIGNDSMVDTPTPYGTDTGVGGEVRGNYCTWNPLDTNSTAALSNGNLTNSSAGANRGIRGTIGVSSGKWYWEWTEADSPDNHIGVWGVSSLTAGVYAYVGEGTDNWGIHTLTGNKRNNGGNVGYGSAYANGNVGMCAMDLDNGKIWWGKNGTWFASGDPASGDNAAFTNLSGTLRPAQLQYSAANFNFGQRAFAYTAPIGFKALCTTNLPTPTIGSSPTSLASQFFTPTLFTGTGAAGNAVTVGFQPDFTWVKDRVQTGGYHHILQDAVRGANKVLYSNLTNAEVTASGFSFTSTGFTVGTGIGDINVSGSAEVAWNWKAGGTAVTNTSGSITSTVSANPTSGFSIVTYTATGSVATIGHGLDSTPSMILLKGRSGITDWFVYHSALGATKGIYLNQSGLSITSANFWNNTAPTPSVFTAGTGVGNAAVTMVAYCFAPIAGYSAFGSYTGNGSADGPFNHTGFRPAFIMWKNAVSTTQAGNWFMLDDSRDTYNTASRFLIANGTDAESNIGVVDFLSNGFKIRYGGGGSVNFSTDTYIWMAFAKNPFKYSLAR